MAVKMNAMDSVSGSLAEVYVTIDGNRYNMMQLYEFEASASVNIVDVPILGQTQMGKKPAGVRRDLVGHRPLQHLGFPKVAFKIRQNRAADPVRHPGDQRRPGIQGRAADGYADRVPD